MAKSTPAPRPDLMTCRDCGAEFSVGKFGRVPSRCGPCRTLHKRMFDRNYQESNRDRHNEANRRYRTRTKRPSPVVTLVCVDCQAEFTKVHSAGRLSVRCPSCRDVYRLARVRKHTAERRRLQPEYFAEYRQRNSARETERATRWAQAHPDRHRARGSRYRSRRFSGVVELFTREQVAERDGWICACCSSPVDPTVRFPDPFAGELDHIIPVTHPNYPGHIWENAALVHSRCNKTKGGWRKKPLGGSAESK